MHWRVVRALVLCFYVSLVLSQGCNTDQNPYCKGNKQFEQLCCPYPSVCYWADRAGTPACCPAGQSCQAAGGVITAPLPTTTIYTTPVTVETASEQSTVTSYVTNPTTAVVVITSTQAPVESATVIIVSKWSTLTSEIAQGYTTVTSVVMAPVTSVINVLNESEQVQPSYIALVIALIAMMVQFV
ncbi:hypothetical protein DV736_g4287, partial [Chaetothyriales sp. CBS 134916]